MGKEQEKCTWVVRRWWLLRRACGKKAILYMSNNDVGGHICLQHRAAMLKDLAQRGQPHYEQDLAE